MPRPVFEKKEISKIIDRSIKFLNISLKSKITFKKNKKKSYLISCDEDQLYRVFINLIKNADESIVEKINKDPNYKGKIDIEIIDNNDYIVILITDNGEGISDKKSNDAVLYNKKKWYRFRVANCKQNY